jgi:hypothetical protein
MGGELRPFDDLDIRDLFFGKLFYQALGGFHIRGNIEGQYRVGIELGQTLVRAVEFKAGRSPYDKITQPDRDNYRD